MNNTMDASHFPDNPVIDIHTHILPKTWPDLAERYGYGGFVQLVHEQPGCADMVIDGESFRRVDENCWSAERRMEECDRHGVDVQVLSTVPVMFSYWAKPEHGLDLSRLLNDHIAEIVRTYPSRFAGLGTIPMQDQNLAIRELERCVRDLGMPGVQIGSSINGMNLDRPEFFSVFQVAEEMGACIFVHPWDMIGGERTRKYWMPWLVGMPAETSLAICSLIFSGVLERLPNLRICFAHGGGAFPATLGRIQHGWEVRPDLCAIDNPNPPKKYVSQIYLDTLVHEPEALRMLIRLFGFEKLALGTDYPFPLGELQPGTLIRGLEELTVEQRHRLLGGTALEWMLGNA
ncbi:MAG: amidohydrolase family protein [Pirellulaceae bacterium]